MKKKAINNLTKRITKTHLVVLSVYLLGGTNKSIDTEDVAIKCDELAPGEFRWKKYKDQINLDLVRRNLSKATDIACNKLLIGSGRKGWRLSTTGIDWINTTGSELINNKIEVNSNLSNSGSIDTVRFEREKQRVQALEGWINWKNNKKITKNQISQVLRIDDYTTTKMLNIKLVRMKSLFQNDNEMSEFINAIEKIIQMEAIT